jgi:two-component system, NarL family, sensor histidine kinase DegS
MDREADPKEELIGILSEEMKRIKDRLGEIKAQIDQTQQVVDREQHRNADIASELSIIQENFDTVPRQDIRTKYDEAMDARFRLATMRGQLEKFQDNRGSLEKQQTLLSQLLTKLQGVGALAEVDEPSAGEGVPRATMNIVRIVQAQEEERQRLARQMHDGPAQSLTNFILQTEICQRLFDRDPERAAEELNNLKSTASVTFQKVRDFIFDLRPMMLDDLGVVPTVRRYVDSFREKNDFEIKLEILGDERRLETHREVMIFRGIQELIAHARDYANATKVSIRLDMTSNVIKIVVTDDGRGFDAEAVFMSSEQPVNDARIQSLITLREKFELVGGSLNASSSETDGTTIRLELPGSDDGF